MVRSRWEAQREAHDDGRPPRRYYELTSRGSEALAEALERFAAHQKVFAAEPSPGSSGGSTR
jgi:DNA-binding PadR family transcriptional regulator